MDQQVTKNEILELFPFYQRLSQTFQRELLHSAELVALPKGAYYFEEGQSCSNIALLSKGDIRVFKRGETGREITLYHVEKGETCILTASCVLGNSTYPASAIVDQDAQAVVFSAGLFRDWVARNDEIRHFVFETMASRMARVLSLIGEITFGKMDQRLAKFLQGNAPKINMTHEEIAIELGSVREVISRLLKELERKGAINQSRGMIQIFPESF